MNNNIIHSNLHSSFGFARDFGDCALEFSNGKRTGGKFHVSILLKDSFGFAQHQENTLFGSGYK